MAIMTYAFLTGIVMAGIGNSSSDEPTSRLIPSVRVLKIVWFGRNVEGSKSACLSITNNLQADGRTGD